LWKGWILPATPANSWLTAGSTLYWKALTSENPDKTVESYRTQLRGLELTHDRPLLQMNGDLSSTAWASVTALKGTLFLAALRKEMGSDELLNFLNGFFDAHTTRTVTTAELLNALDQKWKKPHDELVTTWLKRSGLPGAGNGPLYVARFRQEDLSNTVIVYGTVTEAGANRYAAERLQAEFLDAFESRVPLLRDYEVTPDQLRLRNVVFVGRPETNSMLENTGPAPSVCTSMATRLTYEAWSMDLKTIRSCMPQRIRWIARIKCSFLPGTALSQQYEWRGPRGMIRTFAQYAIYDRGKLVDSGFLE
jgi:hypothetical protein